MSKQRAWAGVHQNIGAGLDSAKAGIVIGRWAGKSKASSVSGASTLPLS
jgi:hypothetical protein